MEDTNRFERTWFVERGEYLVLIPAQADTNYPILQQAQPHLS